MENKQNIVTFLSTSKFHHLFHDFPEEYAFLFHVVNNFDWNKHTNFLKNDEERQMKITIVLGIEWE